MAIDPLTGKKKRDVTAGISPEGVSSQPTANAMIGTAARKTLTGSLLQDPNPVKNIYAPGTATVAAQNSQNKTLGDVAANSGTGQFMKSLNSTTLGEVARRTPAGQAITGIGNALSNRMGQGQPATTSDMPSSIGSFARQGLGMVGNAAKPLTDAFNTPVGQGKVSMYAKDVMGESGKAYDANGGGLQGSAAATGTFLRGATAMPLVAGESLLTSPGMRALGRGASTVGNVAGKGLSAVGNAGLAFGRAFTGTAPSQGNAIAATPPATASPAPQKPAFGPHNNLALLPIPATPATDPRFQAMRSEASGIRALNGSQFSENAATGATSNRAGVRPTMGSPVYSNIGDKMYQSSGTTLVRPGQNQARTTLLGQPSSQKIGDLNIKFDGMPADERARFTESAQREAARPSQQVARQTMGLPESRPIAAPSYAPNTADNSFGGLFMQGLKGKQDRNYAVMNDAVAKNQIDINGQSQALGIANMNDSTSRRGQDMTYANQAAQNGINAQHYATTDASSVAHNQAQIEGMNVDASAKKQAIGDLNSMQIERERLALMEGGTASSDPAIEAQRQNAIKVQQRRLQILGNEKSEPFKIADTSYEDPTTGVKTRDAWVIDGSGHERKIGGQQGQNISTLPADQSQLKEGDTHTGVDGITRTLKGGRWYLAK